MKPNKKTVRLRDIALKAGVSVNTVSRALRNKPDVSEHTRTTIVRLAEELGYPLPPPPLDTAKPLTIGVLIQDILNPYYANIVQGIEQVLWQERANFLFGCSYRQESRERDVFAFLCQQQIDGLLIGSVVNPDYILSQLAHIQLPVTGISQRFQACEIDYVVGDNYHGAFLATDHLIGLGHTRIAHIAGLDMQSSAGERWRGYQDALRQAGIPCDQRLLRTSDNTIESGYYLTKDLLQSIDDLTAIFAYNDLLALGAFRAIREARLHVPTDISVVGYDDIVFTEFFEVPLTTVYQPVLEIGRKAAELLFERIRRGYHHDLQHIVLRPRLTIRSSTSICPRK
ncbi:LacI family DNA-binding transcriptional regulator [candidate division KSB3 bacterium]|uniref:LacI family DNA-binding transcriptional regulator n=1 Tax=candidate division KSB3 bacterium TaxID=2044937 RepID=A0A9D5Q7Q7_9BACT|nr:LacI family DNA-binding transcriptional regulator [candidate division KSB3 bacterium]MBD3326161.1 LacI family DNA-binding transcriptional regulator [candidate division KSB3 bacterium]